VTGTHLPDQPADAVQTLAIEPRAAWMVATPGFPAGHRDRRSVHRALCRRAGGRLPTAAALGRAVSGVYGVLEETERGSPMSWRLSRARSAWCARSSLCAVRRSSRLGCGAETRCERVIPPSILKRTCSRRPRVGRAAILKWRPQKDRERRTIRQWLRAAGNFEGAGSTSLPNCDFRKY